TTLTEGDAQADRYQVAHHTSSTKRLKFGLAAECHPLDASFDVDLPLQSFDVTQNHDFLPGPKFREPALHRLGRSGTKHALGESEDVLCFVHQLAETFVA